MKKIGFIAPYLQLAEEVRKLAEINGENLSIKIADGKDAVGVAQRMILEEEVGVIISRGGTALFLKDALDIPVVELSVQMLDIMRAIHAVKSHSKCIGVCGYENVVYDVENIAAIYETTLVPIVMHRYESIEEKTLKIENIIKSVDYIVGDAVSCQIATKYGIKSSLIESSSNSIMFALSEAKKILEAIDSEKKRLQELKTILDHSREGIVLLDNESKIKYMNQYARKFLNIKLDDIKNVEVKHIFQNVSIEEKLVKGEEIVDELIDCNHKPILFSMIPIKKDEEIFSIIIAFQDAGNIQNQEEKIREKLYLKGHITQYTFDDIIGNNYRIIQCIKTAKIYAKNVTNVLLMGETGTGKELFAQSIHSFGERKNKPFVAVNCGAVPDNLLESELFGYVEGAFTGAKKGGKIGMFELAHKGTLFLDEISEIGMDLQVKLLRVLQERKVMRLGGEKLIPVDVRIIAATNKNLLKMVRENNFREDLYYRLNVLVLKIPPLRERVDDIPFFVEYFLEKYCTLNNLPLKRITEDSIKMLQKYSWRGNVRELENYIERLVVLVQEDQIKAHHIKNYIEDFTEDERILKVSSNISLLNHDANEMVIDLSKNMKEIEGDIIRYMLEINNGDKTQVAKKLGLGRTTVWRKISELSDEDDVF